MPKYVNWFYCCSHGDWRELSDMENQNRYYVRCYGCFPTHPRCGNCNFATTRSQD